MISEKFQLHFEIGKNLDFEGGWPNKFASNDLGMTAGNHKPLIFLMYVL